jgi:hypothetical protein
LTGPGAYRAWWLFPSTGKIEILTKNASTHIFGRNKLTSSAYEEWWLFDFFALVGHRENKLKKDQDSELPGYHIRWVLGFYD